MEAGPASLPPALPRSRIATRRGGPGLSTRTTLSSRLSRPLSGWQLAPGVARLNLSVVNSSPTALEVLKDGTELQLASFCLADVELRLVGTDDPAFAALKVKYADVLDGAPPGMPPDRGIELELF